MRDVVAKWRIASFIAVQLVAVAGCGKFSGLTEGIVKFDDGSPVTSGSIEFRRVTDKKRFASRIAADGSFQPTSLDGTIGLPAGTYEVVVVQIVLTEDLAIEAHTHGHTVPRRYADYYTSDLSVEVFENQVEPIKIVIEPETRHPDNRDS